MAKEKGNPNLKNKNVQRPYKGMHSDNSPVDQPKDTYRFGLNGIDETRRGDSNFISNERGNEPCGNIPDGFIVLGKVYAGEDKTTLFLVSQDETISEIGIMTENCVYESFVKSTCLGFKISNQIDATFRVIRGCERVVYFTDGLNSPRSFNFEKEEDFLVDNPEFVPELEKWDCDKFGLIPSYSKIPCFVEAEIMQGGNIPSGSYNFAIQYLDENLNPSNWIYTSQTVNIYTINEKTNYFQIIGAENFGDNSLDNELWEEQSSSKSIKLRISNLDDSYTFYRLAVIRAIKGTGDVTDVLASPEIPISQQDYLYTGNHSGYSTITVEELAFSKTDINSAEHIEQIENRLILGNVKGKQINYCNFQRFASSIKSKYSTKRVAAYDVIKGNSKDGTTPFDTMSFLADEIYAFGIVYVFNDGTESPAYHIPGRPAFDFDEEIIDVWEENVAPFFSNEAEYNLLPQGEKLKRWEVYNTATEARSLLAINSMAYHESKTSTYQDIDTCNSVFDYWGDDYYGNPLVGRPIRHHRFPSRQLETLMQYDAEDEQTLEFNVFVLNIDLLSSTQDDCNGGTQTGEFFPYTCDGTDIVSVASITYTVTYTKNGQIIESTGVIFPDDVYPLQIVIDDIAPDDIFDIGTAVLGGEITNYLTWFDTSFDDTNTLTSILNSDTFINILGIDFSNIEYPDPNIIGHYIVVGERDASNRTIYDKGYVNPLRQNGNFITYSGFLSTIGISQTVSSQPDVLYGLIPKNLFLNETSTASYIQLDGYYFPTDNFPILANAGKFQDVANGTTSRGAFFGLFKTDKDGLSWVLGYRWNNYRYYNKTPDIFNFTINRNVSLSPAERKSSFKDGKTLYNTSLDNKVEVFEIESQDFPLATPVPSSDINGAYNIKYIALKNIQEVHPFLDSIKYRRTHNCLQTGEQSIIFGGDIYVSYCSFSHSTYYDTRIPKRWGEVISNIVGIAALAVATVFSAGALAPALGAATTAIVVTLTIATAALGITSELVNQFMKDLEAGGLRDLVFDPQLFAQVDISEKDDLLRYYGEHISGLFWETEINTSLRTQAQVECGSFIKESSQSNINQYFQTKWLHKDPERDYKDSIKPIPCPEVYRYNSDYSRLNWEKIYIPLPQSYNCCSDCLEEHPSRIHYSEQSFQEELTDNYKTFLINNYRDIEAEHGGITDLWRLKNNLYIHTREALWHLPQNVQERVTGDLISFIGTGDFFSIPPRLVVDDDNGSAGSQHKWATIKTKYGVLFITENENKIYFFDGQLRPISEVGLKNFFKENLYLESALDYYNSTGQIYPVINNPSNPIGVGFISTYDSRHERLIITKKDYDLSEVIPNGDYEVCTNGGQLTYFENYQATIAQFESDGWTYLGITDDCRMEFERISEYETIIIEEPVAIPSTIDVWVVYDSSGSFDANAGQQIRDAVAGWLSQINFLIPGWSGQFNETDCCDNAGGGANGYQGENWLSYLDSILTNNYTPAQLATTDILLISFINEAAATYHGNGFNATISSPTGTYAADRASFLAGAASLHSFIGVHYPIAFPTGQSAGFTKEFLMHSMAAVYGVDLTPAQVDAFTGPNPAFTAGEWNTLRNALGNNPYNNDGLINYGWTGKWDRWNNGGQVITTQQFINDINLLLQDNIEINEIEITRPILETTYVDGVVIDPTTVNKSFTVSFGLDDRSWKFFHNYLPYIYIHIPDNHYSFIHGSNDIWKHNGEKFQTYYGQYYPHILEYVSLSNPLSTRIWDDITLNTEARRYINESPVDERHITYNKVWLYNTRQLSGELETIIQDVYEQDYLYQQIVNRPNQIIISREERNWHINDFRDVVVDYKLPLFLEDCLSVQSEYFVDKIINTTAIDYLKDWTQLESFRDKFLIIRLKFDNFDDVELITNYSLETEQPSFR